MNQAGNVPKHRLIVEGKNDYHVITALCIKFSIVESFKIIDKEGKDKLLNSIPAEINLLTRPGNSCLGIVLDTDQDLTKRWKQVKNILGGKGYTLPKLPDPSGTLLPSPSLGLPQIGIWLMPDNKLPGMLEDFIQFLVPSNDESLEFAKEALTTLENRGLHNYIPNHRTKALIHTWLAWQEDPGTPLGLAITRRFLSTDMELCQRFVDWLNRLFNPPEE